jgi:hypothetical protein
MNPVASVCSDDYPGGLGVDDIFTVSEDYFRFNPVIGTDIRKTKDVVIEILFVFLGVVKGIKDVFGGFVVEH